MTLGAKLYIVRWFQKCASDYQTCHCTTDKRPTPIVQTTTDGPQIILSCPNCKLYNRVHPVLFLMMWRAFARDPKNEDKVMERMLLYAIIAGFSLMAAIAITVVMSVNKLPDETLWWCIVSLTMGVWSAAKSIKFWSLHEAFRIEAFKRRTSR